MWRAAESNTKPEAAIALSDGRVLVRRNITEKQTEEGNTAYQYEERIMSAVEYGTREAVQDMELKREAEIIDDYTLELIEEGVL